MFAAPSRPCSSCSGSPAVQVGPGTVLIAMGVLVLTGELFRLNIEVQQFLDGLGINFFQDV